MYDNIQDNCWHVEVQFTEDDTHTHATVRATRDDGTTVTAQGDAYRNPRDSAQPLVGEEIAAARGFIALGSQLLQDASSRIEQSTRQPVHLFR
ncbi:DUF1876 domain-containing protein [Mycolicibacterium phlei]